MRNIKKLLIALPLIGSSLIMGAAHAKAATKTVSASAYTSHASQTSGDPFLAAWGNRLKPGSKVIAISRDLEKQGLRNGSKVQIAGMGTFTVRDRMSSRWKNKVDLYMGTNHAKARAFGVRKLKISW